MNSSLSLAFLTVILAAPVLADSSPGQELSLAYGYLRANAPPDHCDCFSMNGASAGYLYDLSGSWGLVADLGVEHTGSVRATGLGLTLSSALGGVRFTDRFSDRGPLSVFAQTLVGATRSSGGLATAEPAVRGASTDFSALIGAGLDIRVSRHFSIRAFELDYFLTTLPNGVNGYQNNLRASAGLVYRFGGTPPAASPAAIVREPVIAAPSPAPSPAPVVAAVPAPAPVCNSPAGLKMDADCHLIEQSVIIRAIDFENNSIQLTAPARATLDAVAAALQGQAGLAIEIRGFTDSRGSVAYNLRLSRRRAEAVKTYLVERGVDARTLSAHGFGMADPIADNETDTGRTQNRRVSFEVTRASGQLNVRSEGATEESIAAARQKR